MLCHHTLYTHVRFGNFLCHFIHHRHRHHYRITIIIFILGNIMIVPRGRDERVGAVKRVVNIITITITRA